MPLAPESTTSVSWSGMVDGFGEGGLRLTIAAWDNLSGISFKFFELMPTILVCPDRQSLPPMWFAAVAASLWPSAFPLHLSLA